MNNPALWTSLIFAAAMLLTVLIGLWSGRGREKSLQEWSVSGRSLGTMLILVLMAGESYTSFSFLGTAGWAYEYGVPILFLVAYLSVGLTLAYCVAPLIWTYAQRHGLLCISDIVEHRFGSRRLAIGVVFLSTLFLLPYIQLQIQGMATVVNAMSYGAIDLQIAAIVAFVVTISFVLVSGLRGSVWVSVAKDGLVILAVVFLAIYLPAHYFGGPGPFLHRLVAEKHQWLTLPGAGASPFGARWFASTVLLNAVTMSIVPTTVAGYLSARSPNALRRNAIILPWYQLLLLVPMMIGLMALFVVPQLEQADLALYSLVLEALPVPLVALMGIAGALSAIVPMSVFMLAIGTMWGRTVLGGGLRAGSMHAGQKQGRYARLVCLLVGLLGLAGSLFWPSALVSLSVLSYEGLAQLVPAVLISLYWPRMGRQAALAGLLTGTSLMLGLHYGGHDPWHGINGGLLALLANLAVVAAVSWRRPDIGAAGQAETNRQE